MKKLEFQSGFSAVELLITLFIAFLFVMMGYQLYGVAIRNSADARNQATASNIAYKYLRQYSALAVNGTCPAPLTSPPTNTSISAEMSNAFLTVTASCPQPTAIPDLKLVTVKVTYGNPQQGVSHAIYAGQ